MRHLKKGKKFHRMTAERKTFLRNLVVNLIRTGKMETTETRAKAIRPLIERSVTLARRNTLASRRLLLARLHNMTAVRRLFDEWAPRYAGRAGGYLRVTKLGKVRKRDGSRLARIEFI